jgi:hypothetical protein
LIRHGEKRPHQQEASTQWTIDELNKTVARKIETAKKYQPGPKRQKLLREAKRYQTLLETKNGFRVAWSHPHSSFHEAA